jgi:hypothetical protein
MEGNFVWKGNNKKINCNKIKKRKKKCNWKYKGPNPKYNGQKLKKLCPVSCNQTCDSNK